MTLLVNSLLGQKHEASLFDLHFGARASQVLMQSVPSALLPLRLLNLQLATLQQFPAVFPRDRAQLPPQAWMQEMTLLVNSLLGQKHEASLFDLHFGARASQGSLPQHRAPVHQHLARPRPEV
jgi:hypothetical protein